MFRLGASNGWADVASSADGVSAFQVAVFASSSVSDADRQILDDVGRLANSSPTGAIVGVFIESSIGARAS